MRKLLFLVVSMIIWITAYPQVHVKGYYRKNGTYVKPHMRSSPDGNPYNNYSYPGNTNPYTGKTATGSPQTYLKRYPNSVYAYTLPYPIPVEMRTPMQDRRGRYIGYTYSYPEDDVTNIEYIFSSAHIQVGYARIYSTGDIFLYNMNDRLVKHYRPRKQKN